MHILYISGRCTCIGCNGLDPSLPALQIFLFPVPNTPDSTDQLTNSSSWDIKQCKTGGTPGPVLGICDLHPSCSSAAAPLSHYLFLLNKLSHTDQRALLINQLPPDKRGGEPPQHLHCKMPVRWWRPESQWRSIHSHPGIPNHSAAHYWLWEWLVCWWYHLIHQPTPSCRSQTLWARKWCQASSAWNQIELEGLDTAGAIWQDMDKWEAEHPKDFISPRCMLSLVELMSLLYLWSNKLCVIASNVQSKANTSARRASIKVKAYCNQHFMLTINFTDLLLFPSEPDTLYTPNHRCLLDGVKVNVEQCPCVEWGETLGLELDRTERHLADEPSKQPSDRAHTNLAFQQ